MVAISQFIYVLIINRLKRRRKEEADFWIPCNKIPEQIEEEKYTVAGLIPGKYSSKWLGKNSLKI